MILSASPKDLLNLQAFSQAFPRDTVTHDTCYSSIYASILSYRIESISLLTSTVDMPPLTSTSPCLWLRCTWEQSWRKTWPDILGTHFAPMLCLLNLDTKFGVSMCRWGQITLSWALESLRRDAEQVRWSSHRCWRCYKMMQHGGNSGVDNVEQFFLPSVSQLKEIPTTKGPPEQLESEIPNNCTLALRTSVLENAREQ